MLFICKYFQLYARKQIFANLENNNVYQTKIETVSKLEFLSGLSK